MAWLSKRKRRQAENEAYRLAFLCSVIVNYSMRAPKEPCKPEDFLPRVGRSSEGSRGLSPEELTDEMRDEIADSFRRLFGAMEER